MEQLHVVYAVVGTLAVALAGLSIRIRRLPFSEPLLALVAGVVVGPQVLGLVEVPEAERSLLLSEAARTLLAISLIGVALRYPVRRLRPVIVPTAVLVTVGMVAMAGLSALLAWALLPVAWPLALLVGACTSPTDPVLASSVVTGDPAEQGLPSRLRQLISEESGTNDGLALPLVLLGIAVALGESAGRALATGAYQIAAGVLVGLVLGAVAGRAVRAADRRSDVDKGSFLVLTLLLAIAVLGITRLLDADGILSVFVAGLAYNHAVSQGESELEPQDTVDEAVNRYVVLPLFLLLGVELPWSDWRDLGWAAVAFPVAVLLLRRWPVVLALRPVLRLGWRDAVFLGWFGPVGVSALFYLTFSREEGVDNPTLWAAGSLVVAASTVVHGVTSSPGRVLYQRAAASGS